MDIACLTILLTEARAAARELRDITRLIVITPGALHSLAQCLLDLTTTCQYLHHQNLRWMGAAAQ
jgi:hypothetical protein